MTCGQDIDTIARLLGQADLRMSQRYTHLSPEFLRKATAGIDGVFGAQSGKEKLERTSIRKFLHNSVPNVLYLSLTH